jgi:aerobic carbon-monoxide dehydrogenase large subunit
VLVGVVAYIWSVDAENVVVAFADTSLVAMEFGTIASRSTVTLSGAISRASERLRAKVLAIAASLVECAPSDLELRNGRVGAPDGRPR